MKLRTLKEVVENTVVSNFWMAVIASIILVTTALLLKDNDGQSIVLIFEGALFGVRGLDETIKNYRIVNEKRTE